MPWTCKFIERDELVRRDFDAQPGEMWFINNKQHVVPGFGTTLSLEYIRDWLGKRPPLCVCLPDGNWWFLDFHAHNTSSGWTITGSIPQISANPSILTPTYHGYLRNGILSDDLEGRTYHG